MTDWEASLVAGLLQVALVSLIALGLLGRSRQWGGIDRLRLCQAAFAGVMLLSLLALGRPLLSEWPGWTTATSPAATATRESSETASSTETDAADSRGVVISWAQLQDVGRKSLSLLGARTAQAVWPQWRWWVVVPVALLATLAAVRLSLAGWWLRRLCRTSRPFTDDSLAAELDSLKRDYGLRSPVLLRETSALSQAAVIGWRRPVILLPGDWRDWSAAELRLVLAHELAHIRQGDVRWRWLAEVVLVLHACQPLVYWLHRRLVLEQELAADRAAAEVCGGAAAYLRTLSTLALRCDIRPERTTLAPVLTGLLLRRVEMLQTREGRTVSRTRWWFWIKPVALCAAVALAGGLQLPAAEEPERVSESQPSKVVTAVADDGVSAPSNLFSRKIETPLLVPHASGGLIEVRLHDLFSGPGGELLTKEVRQELTEELAETVEDLFGEAGVYAITVLRLAVIGNEVEAVAADINMFVSYLHEAPAGQRHQLGFGARSLRFRMKGDRDWSDHLPDGLPKYRGVPYLAFPVLSAEKTKKLLQDAADQRLSDEALSEQMISRSKLRMCAAYPDPRNVVLVFGEGELKHVFPEQPPVLSETVARLRQAVAGGVLTIVLPAASLKRQKLEVSDEPGDKAANELLQHAEVVALGVDIAPDNRLAVRLRGSYQNAGQARVAEQQARALVRLAQDALSKVGTILKVENEVPKQVDGGVTFYREFLQNHELSVEGQPDGTADLVFESNGSGWFERQ